MPYFFAKKIKTQKVPPGSVDTILKYYFSHLVRKVGIAYFIWGFKKRILGILFTKNGNNKNHNFRHNLYLSLLSTKIWGLKNSCWHLRYAKEMISLLCQQQSVPTICTLQYLNIAFCPDRLKNLALPTSFRVCKAHFGTLGVYKGNNIILLPTT